MRALPAWLSMLGLIVTMAGCGPSRPVTVPVHGVVLFTDGTPVHGGRIEFESITAGINARGTLNADGEFTLTTFRDGDGAVPGPHRVIVQQDLSTYSGLSGKVQHGPHGPPPTKIPLQYADYRTSPLTVEVSRDGDDNLRVELAPADRQDALE